MVRKEKPLSDVVEVNWKLLAPILIGLVAGLIVTLILVKIF